MPAPESVRNLKLARRIRAFLNPPAADFETASRKLEEARSKLSERRKELREKEREIAGLKGMLARRENTQSGVRPENIVWVFGSGRTGSSWLTYMMRELPDHSRWNEPLVGRLFGDLYYVRGADRRERTRNGKNHFILGDDHREVWLDLIRSFVLDSASARFPERIENGYLVIKEPHGSIGAPLIMEALPESRMIFLVRDPRDVMASKVDAHKPGSWASKKVADDPDDPVKGVVWRAKGYVRDIELTGEAYEAHAGKKSFVRYEDLRSDTLANMRRIYSELDIEADEEKLAEAVRKHAWENIPEEEKGAGKIRRKAKPGGWKEDLTEEQIEIVERITAPLLRAFYADRS
jgi:hypothetical protein